MWADSPRLFLFAGFFMDCVSAGKQCREEQSVNGMALQGFVFTKFFVRALHECDISCETEITCQSYNYVMGEKSCELNNRTKEARPQNFRSDSARFYKRRLSDRGMYKLISIWNYLSGQLNVVSSVRVLIPNPAHVRYFSFFSGSSLIFLHNLF